MNGDYNTLSNKYKIKFYNFILGQFLNKFGGYDLQHDDMVYKLSNFGAKVKPTYINFSLGTLQPHINELYQLLESYNIFEINKIEPNIIQINFDFTSTNISKLKTTRSKTESQKKMKQLVLNCYRKMSCLTETQNLEV